MNSWFSKNRALWLKKKKKRTSDFDAPGASSYLWVDDSTRETLIDRPSILLVRRRSSRDA